jgi:3-carboxy-cis,cis-muconate cycloisomerase
LERVALSESFLLTAASLNNAKFMLGSPVVHEGRKRQNLDLTHGLIVAHDDGGSS